ncbi:MAG: copper-binding protein [Acidobacteriota bacterium]
MAWMVLAPLMFLVACTKSETMTPQPSGKPAEAAGAQTQPAGTGDPADYYTVRAKVIGLPEPGSEFPRIFLHHEAIKDLKGVDGAVWGMDSMTMPFFLAKGVDLNGVAVGDIVEFTLKVDWKAETPQEIISMKRLQPGTQLVLPGEGSSS